MRRDAILTFVGYTLASALFTGLYHSATASHSLVILPRLVAGTFTRPLQYRALFPYATQIIHRATGLSVTRVSWLLTFGAILGLLYAFRRYLRHYLSRDEASAWALFILYPMAWNYCALNCYYMPCDIPAILFFVLGLDAILNRAWLKYYLIFILSTFNRETSCFLTVAYAITHYRVERPIRLIGHCVLQVLLWLAVKRALVAVYGDNPGSDWRWRLPRNLAWFASPGLHTILRLLVFGGIWGVVLLPFLRASMPAFVRQLTWVAIPFLAGMLLVGDIDEVRIYNELVPVLAAPAILAWIAFLGRREAEVREGA